jgi:hypothetical protein
MKPQVFLTTPSSRGCVGTKGVKPTEARMYTNTHPTDMCINTHPTDMRINTHPNDTPTEAPTSHKKVSWRDALFPRRPLVDVDL